MSLKFGGKFSLYTLILDMPFKNGDDTTATATLVDPNQMELLVTSLKVLDRYMMRRSKNLRLSMTILREYMDDEILMG